MANEVALQPSLKHEKVEYSELLQNLKEELLKRVGLSEVYEHKPVPNKSNNSHSNICYSSNGSPDSNTSSELDWNDTDSTGYECEKCSDINEYEMKGKLPPSISFPSNATHISVQRVLILCNPNSGSHRGKKIARKAQELFEGADVKTELITLERKGHAEELCETMNFSGFDVMCIIGGDGTFHESVNGLMKRKDNERARIPIAMIPGGTGNSFALELQGGVKVSRAVKHVIRGLNCPIDVSRVAFPAEIEREREVFCFNSLHWGLASKVNVTAERLRWMGKAIRYTTAALVELFQGEKTFAKVVIEDSDGKKIVYKEEFCLIIANNIVTAAKGMKLAPSAKLNDGLIDLLLIRSSGKWDLMQLFKRLYDGTHTELSYVEYLQVKQFSVTPFRVLQKTPSGTPTELEVESETDPDVAEELIDIDGELKGLTPFSCAVVPQAIRVIL